MKRYRSKPPLQARCLRSDDGWDDINMMAGTITVYETEAAWEPIGILGPDGQPIEALVGGMEPIGFVHFDITPKRKNCNVQRRSCH